MSVRRLENPQVPMHDDLRLVPGTEFVVMVYGGSDEVARAGVIGKRLVRHGLADILAWLGEDVGPGPDDPVEQVLLLHPRLSGVFLLPEMPEADDLILKEEWPMQGLARVSTLTYKGKPVHQEIMQFGGYGADVWGAAV